MDSASTGLGSASFSDASSVSWAKGCSSVSGPSRFSDLTCVVEVPRLLSTPQARKVSFRVELPFESFDGRKLLNDIDVRFSSPNEILLRTGLRKGRQASRVSKSSQIPI